MLLASVFSSHENLATAVFSTLRQKKDKIGQDET